MDSGKSLNNSVVGVRGVLDGTDGAVGTRAQRDSKIPGRRRRPLRGFPVGSWLLQSPVSVGVGPSVTEAVVENGVGVNGLSLDSGSVAEG